MSRELVADHDRLPARGNVEPHCSGLATGSEDVACRLVRSGQASVFCEKRRWCSRTVGRKAEVRGVGHSDQLNVSRSIKAGASDLVGRPPATPLAQPPGECCTPKSKQRVNSEHLFNRAETSHIGQYRLLPSLEQTEKSNRIVSRCSATQS